MIPIEARFDGPAITGANLSVVPPDRSELRKILKAGEGIAVAELAETTLAPALSFFAPPGMTLTLASEVAGRPVVVKKAELEVVAEIHSDGELLGDIWFVIDARTRIVKHRRVVAYKNAIGKRLGRKLLRNTQRLYDAIEIRRIELLAGGSHGAELWARAGFDVVSPMQRQGVEDDLGQVLNHLPFSPWKELPAEWSMHEIVGLRALDEQKRSIAEIIEVLEAEGGPEYRTDCGSLKLHDVDVAWSRGLGEALVFLVAPWVGLLDLDNPVIRGQYEAYLAS